MHIVTTGVSNHSGDMDLNPETYGLIHENDPESTSEHPRPMTWQLVEYPASGNIQYQFQTGANPYWTSFWVRNHSLPLSKVEVKSVNHADWFELRRETDGTYNDDGGFGEGAFQLQLTALTGDVVVDDQPGFTAGALEPSTQQF